MDPQTRAALTGFLRDKTLQLFADYGLPLTESESQEPPLLGPTVAGLLGLLGPELRATITIAAPEEVLTATSSANVVAQNEDWIGELANQLAGRFKNELVRWGVQTSLGTPVSLTCTALRLREHAQLDQLAFGSDAGPIHVWLKTEQLQPIVLAEESASVLDEGELFLF